MAPLLKVTRRAAGFVGGLVAKLLNGAVSASGKRYNDSSWPRYPLF